MTTQARVLLRTVLLPLGRLAWSLGHWLTTVMEGPFILGSCIESPLCRLASIQLKRRWVAACLEVLLPPHTWPVAKLS